MNVYNNEPVNVYNTDIDMDALLDATITSIRKNPVETKTQQRFNRYGLTKKTSTKKRKTKRKKK